MFFWPAVWFSFPLVAVVALGTLRCVFHPGRCTWGIQEERGISCCPWLSLVWVQSGLWRPRAQLPVQSDTGKEQKVLKHKLSPGEWTGLERWDTLGIFHKFCAAWSWRGTASPGISSVGGGTPRSCSLVPASLQGFLPAFVIPGIIVHAFL